MGEEPIKDALARYVNEKGAIIYLVLDQDGLILQANDYSTQLVGHSLENQTFFDITVNFGAVRSIRELVESEAEFHIVHISTASGLPQTFYFRFLAVGGKVLAFGELNSLEIETLRKNLLSTNHELNLLGRELQKKNAELVKLNDLKNQFLGMAAHDLRNPISIILNYSEFLLDEAVDSLKEEQIQFLGVIRKSSEFMLGLLNDLLDIAKIESGKLDLALERTDLAALIKTNVALNQVIAQKKSIQLVFQDYEQIPEVQADKEKIHQVLNNLISNAIKFSPAQTVIHIDVFRTGENVTVSVTDQGPGIPAEDGKKLFHPFSKTSVKSTGGEKTTGLGLAIVKKIVNGHRGNIWVESSLGKGSTFSFSLPLPAHGADASNCL